MRTRLTMLLACLLLCAGAHAETGVEASLRDLLQPVAPDPATLPELVERIDALSAKLEADKDVKCWTSLGQLETFVAGSEFSPRATHLKTEVVVHYLDQVWRDAAAQQSGPVSVEAFDAAAARHFAAEQVGYATYRVGIGERQLELPYQDVRDYEITVEPLRVLRTVAQRAADATPDRPPLSSAAIESARHLAALLSTVVLKEASATARANRHRQVEHGDVTAADRELAQAAGLEALGPERAAATPSAPVAPVPRETSRAAMHEIIRGKIEALATFNTRYSAEELRESFDPSLVKAERSWAERPVEPVASRLYKEEILVDLAASLYREAAKRHPESDLLTGPQMLETQMSRYPFVQEFFGTINLFPAADDAANVWVPEHLGDTFRDSGWHWKALERAVAKVEAADAELPPMDLYALEELSEFLSIYAVALVTAAGNVAGEAGAAQVTPAALSATQKVFEKNRKLHGTASDRRPAPAGPQPAEWEAAAETARSELRQSYVAETFSDVTAGSGIAFSYEESPMILRLRFPERRTASNLFGAAATTPRAGHHPESPVTEVGIAGGGVAVADVDGDDLLDIYLVSGVEDRLFRNLGNLRFEDVTAKSGLGSRDQGRGAYFVDYDNDGDKDLFVTQVYAPNRLYRNRGDGTFEDVTAASGLSLRTDLVSHSATWFDFDNDGHLDVYVGNFGNWPSGRAPRLHHSRNGEPNQLFRSRGDGTFEDVTEATRSGSVGWTHAVSHFDANGDGWQDLYLANDFGADELLINLQGERFLDGTPKDHREKSLHGMSVGFTEVNGDGVEDVYVSNIAMFSFVSKYINPGDETEVRLSRRTVENARMVENNAFLVSQDGTFAERQHEFFDKSQSGDGWAWDADFFDFDNDGLEDLYVANGREPFVTYDRERNVLYRQSNGRFFDVSAESGADIAANSRGVVAADFDLDGDLDLVVNNYRAPATLLRNNLRRNHWLRVQLRGRRSNRDGIGARVSVETASGSQHRTVRGGSGFLSSEPSLLSFGLGSAERAERIEVAWPSGLRQVVEGAAANQTIQIDEGRAVADSD